MWNRSIYSIIFLTRFFFPFYATSLINRSIFRATYELFSTSGLFWKMYISSSSSSSSSCPVYPTHRDYKQDLERKGRRQPIPIKSLPTLNRSSEKALSATTRKPTSYIISLTFNNY